LSWCREPIFGLGLLLVLQISSGFSSCRLLNCIKHFPNLLRLSCDLYPSFHLCAVLPLLICVCRNILESLESSKHDHGYDHSNGLLNLFFMYAIEYFCICVHQGNWSVGFCCSHGNCGSCVLIHFWYQGTSGCNLCWQNGR
jgi:hypothetical protein